MSLVGDYETVVLKVFDQIGGNAVIDHDGTAHHLPAFKDNRAVFAGFQCLRSHGRKSDDAAIIGNREIDFGDLWNAIGLLNCLGHDLPFGVRMNVVGRWHFPSPLDTGLR